MSATHIGPNGPQRTNTGPATAGRLRVGARSYAREIVARWPRITPEAQDEIRAILAPIVNRTAADLTDARGSA